MYNIRNIRESKRMTQIELAGLSNISRVTLVRIENGQAEPTVKTLKSVAKALGVSIEELIA